MAHLRLGMQLAGQDLTPEQRRSWRYDFRSDERLGVYLTNSLSEGLEQVDLLPMAPTSLTKPTKLPRSNGIAR